MGFGVWPWCCVAAILSLLRIAPRGRSGAICANAYVMSSDQTSRIPGFYKLNIAERLEQVRQFANLSDEEVATLRGTDPEMLARANKMIENVVGLFTLPVGIAANFRIDGDDVLVPMVIEEPSVVAACSNAAKLLRGGHGIVTTATEDIMIGQIQLLGVRDLAAASRSIEAVAEELVQTANDSQPRLVARGGGARRIVVRPFPKTDAGPMLIVHVHVNVCDAMGANLVNGIAETLAREIEGLTGGRALLKILSNLADQRLVEATGYIPISALERPKLGMRGQDVADRIVAASVFAEVDPYRAATHNKGIMNGVDAFLLAAGQDLRAVEAGAHAYAARDGIYTAMATWRRHEDTLVGHLQIPMQVGVVGGIVKVHPVVQVLLKVADAKAASTVGRIAAAVGLAQNLAAVMALATEGIQRGHMSLHARNIAAAVGARDEDISAIVAEMIRRESITHAAAASILKESAERRAKDTLSLSEMRELRDRLWPDVDACIKRAVAGDAVDSSDDGEITFGLLTGYQLGQGGKRLRATIALAVYQAFGKNPVDVAPFAAAMELLHNATMVHDDLQQKDISRRGKEAAWVAFGTDQAVNLGDGLFYAALKCLRELGFPAAVRDQLTQMIVDYMLGIVRAQVSDRTVQSTGDAGPDAWLKLSRDRIGGLFKMAVVGAAVLAGADQVTCKRVEACGEHLGVIFMVQDQLLDLMGAEPGQRGHAVVDGKLNLLTTYALHAAGQPDGRELWELLQKPANETTDADADRALTLLEDAGAFDYAMGIVREHHNYVESLTAELPASLQRFLRGLTEIVLDPVVTRARTVV